MKWLVLFVFSAALVGCSAGNRPGVTKDAEAGAAKAFAEKPSAKETVELIREGEQVYRRSGCGNCHSLTEDRSGFAGPPLSGVGRRNLKNHDNDELKVRRWLFKHIRDPIQWPGEMADRPEYEGTHMPPNPYLKDEDLKALVEYLYHLE